MTDAVKVTRRLSIPAEAAFDAWIDPLRIRAWMLAPSPADSVQRVELEPMVGGSFRFVVRRDGQDVAHVGKYLEKIRPTRLVFTWLVPRYSSDATRVTVDIVPLEDACEVTLTHDGVATEFAEQTRAGWSAILAAMNRQQG
jgi:uncharacterized protein YndB with AHSA1/START domain